MIFNLTPAFIFLFGGLLTFLLNKRTVKFIPLLVPIFGFLSLRTLTESSTLNIPFLFSNLQFLKVDDLSILFGTLFMFVAFISFMYGFKIAKSSEYTAALIYIGSALSVVFAGDFITLYIFWELMALSSVFLVLLNNTDASRRSALRYIIVHLVGGLILLAGIILQYQATGSFDIRAMSLSTVYEILIFIGLLINAAGAPFSSWLTDSYPESTAMGGVILSSITTKTAIYTLIRGFSGSDALIWIGAFTAVYGVVYGLLENNMRRTLSFSVVNQVGFKLVGIGVGSPLAIAGVCAHVVCGVIYNSVLWMSAGSLNQYTGKVNFTDLRGLSRNYPLLFIFTLIGGLSIASFPLTSGYISKNIILKAVELNHLFTPWLFLEFASFGVVLFITCKFIYYGFIYQNDKSPSVPLDSSLNHPFMFLATSICAFLCLFLGFSPAILYEAVPYSDYLLKKVPYSFVGIYSNVELLIIQFQKIFFAILAFILFKHLVPLKSKVIIDFDWLYRRLFRYIALFLISFIDFTYVSINKIVMIIVNGISFFFRNSLAYLLYIINLPSLRLSNVSINKYELLKRYNAYIINNGFPFALIGSFIFILSILLLLLGSL